MRQILTLAIFTFYFTSQILAQVTISGSVLNSKQEQIAYCTVILKSAIDSTMVKADITSDLGNYTFELIKPGKYFIQASYVGMEDYTSEVIRPSRWS
jgi:iron complex outermembrane recepter protein